jgi:D-xylose transport system substrate-binding protein
MQTSNSVLIIIKITFRLSLQTLMKILKLAVLALSALIISSCSSSGPSQNTTTGNSGTNAPAAGKKITIGFAMATLKEERWQRDHDAFEARCKELNVECKITVADNSSSRQSNDVDNLLTQGVDVLVIAPQNATEAAAMVDKAKAQGVPVISYDRLINSPKLDLYISHQVPVIGRQMVEYAVQKVPKGKYVMVYGASTDNNAHIMSAAQLEFLKPFTDRGDIKIVAFDNIDDWKSELALNFVENILTKESDDIQAIIVSNDGMAGGVVSALEKRGIAGKILVTGQDAQLDALQRIAEGKQAMTVYKPIIPLASGAVDAAIKLAKKESLDTKPFKNDANGSEVPSILLPVISVDKDNLMTTVIKDGFAKFDDVYKNVPASDRPKQN